jgi:hypothetical protein
MRLPVLWNRDRLRNLVWMLGITKAMQDELYADVLRVGNDADLDRIRQKCEEYERNGARFMYHAHGAPVMHDGPAPMDYRVFYAHRDDPITAHESLYCALEFALAWSTCSAEGADNLVIRRNHALVGRVINGVFTAAKE